jgi:hypothetical protein
MFSGLGMNFRLGLAGIAMVGSEWWCWEIVGLATSYLGPTALAAQSVLRESLPPISRLQLTKKVCKTHFPVSSFCSVTTASLFYQCQYALSVAAAVRIGSKSPAIHLSPRSNERKLTTNRGTISFRSPRCSKTSPRSTRVSHDDSHRRDRFRVQLDRSRPLPWSVKLTFPSLSHDRNLLTLTLELTLGS